MKRRTWSGAIAGGFIRRTMGPAGVNSTLERCTLPAAPRSKGSAAQLAPQQLVELRRIGFAARRLHHLADEESEELVLAGAVLGELRRVLRHDLLDRTRNRGA